MQHKTQRMSLQTLGVAKYALELLVALCLGSCQQTLLDFAKLRKLALVVLRFIFNALRIAVLLVDVRPEFGHIRTEELALSAYDGWQGPLSGKRDALRQVHQVGFGRAETQWCGIFC